MISLRVLLVALTLCASTALATVHRYHVAVDPALARVAVEARVSGPASLRARDGRASDVSDLATCDGQPLATQGDRIVLPEGIDCVRYRYPLGDERAERSNAMRRPAVARGTVVSSPGQWLWLPVLGAGDRVRVNVALPEGKSASVPWRPGGDGAYELGASPRSSRAVAVFGSFRQHDVDLPGTRLRVALLDGPDQPLSSPATEAKILSWVQAAAMDVAGVSGAFPNPSPQVIVQPSPGSPWGGSRSPVPFGYVIRDGGETVRFFVDPESSLEEFLGDWTATHEFSHLLLPYVRSREKWISEGFASYYQNVLLARRGVYTEQEAWQRLHRSFRQAGEIDDPPTLRDLDSRPFWEVRMLIYWGGAALALLADAELRGAGNGLSLDEVLGRLRACCLPSERAWGGRELFARLDDLSGHEIFLNLYARHTVARGMPDLERLYADLGIAVDGSRVSLVDSAPLASVRRAIMAPKPLVPLAARD